jgi:hypothetical protein
MLNFIHPSVYMMIDEVIYGWRVESGEHLLGEIVLFGARYASVCPSRESTTCAKSLRSLGGFLLSFEE